MPSKRTWDKIEHEWVTGKDDITLLKLAVKYEVKHETIRKRAQRNHWGQLRKEYRGEADELRKVAKLEARQQTLQEMIQDILEGTKQDYEIYDQLIALGIQDVTGRYGDSQDGRTEESKDAQRKIKIFAPTLLTAIRDRRKLREWVHGEEKPVPDVTGVVEIKTEDLSDDERSAFLKSLANLSTKQD